MQSFAPARNTLSHSHTRRLFLFLPPNFVARPLVLSHFWFRILLCLDGGAGGARRRRQPCCGSQSTHTHTQRAAYLNFN